MDFVLFWGGFFITFPQRNLDKKHIDVFYLCFFFKFFIHIYSFTYKPNDFFIALAGNSEIRGYLVSLIMSNKSVSKSIFTGVLKNDIPGNFPGNYFTRR